MTLEFVLAIHRDQLEVYGGESGIRDESGLESALAQPEIEVFGQALHPTVLLKAAAYLYHLALNHPFLDGNNVDGNKRVAWAVMETYLVSEGFELTVNNHEAYNLTVQVAQGELTKEEIAARLRPHLS